MLRLSQVDSETVWYRHSRDEKKNGRSSFGSEGTRNFKYTSELGSKGSLQFCSQVLFPGFVLGFRSQVMFSGFVFPNLPSLDSADLLPNLVLHKSVSTTDWFEIVVLPYFQLGRRLTLTNNMDTTVRSNRLLSE